MGTHVDGLKFAGGRRSVESCRTNDLTPVIGSFSLFQEKPLRELIDLAHEHGVYVSTVSLPCTMIGFKGAYRLI